MDYFDNDSRSIILDTELRDEAFVVKPPTIGLKRCFDQYLKIQKENKVEINTTFYKIAPFLKPDISFMEWDELEGEVVQTISIRLRLLTEGDEVNGVTPPPR